jgi:Coenzyme PQQ synthesis protein D (PqqD)
MSLAFSTRIIPASDVMFRMVDDEIIMLNLKTELYLGCDAVGTRMWVALTESDSIQAAYESLLTEFDVEPGELRRDLEEFIDKILKQGLIEIKPGGAALQNAREKSK